MPFYYKMTNMPFYYKMTNMPFYSKTFSGTSYTYMQFGILHSSNPFKFMSF